MKSNKNITGGILVGLVFLGLRFIPAEIKSLLHIFLGIGGIFLTLYLILKRKSIKQILFVGFLTIIFLMFSLAYIEYKSYGTESMLSIAGVVSFAIATITCIIWLVTSLKKHEVVMTILALIMTLGCGFTLIVGISKIFNI